MQGFENKFLSKIYGRGRGWAFTKTDFVAEFADAGGAGVSLCQVRLSINGRYGFR